MDPRRREELRLKLLELLGAEAASTVMEALPPMDWDELATKRDLERFATKQDLERFATKQDLERFATKQDLERFATKQDLEVFGRSLANELRADFRLELNHAITAQTRTIVLGMIGSSFTFASLVLAASRLG